MSPSRPKPDRAPLIALLRMRAEGEPVDAIILDCFAFIGERLASIPNDERESLLDRGDRVMAASLDEELRSDERNDDVLWGSDESPIVIDDHLGTKDDRHLDDDSIFLAASIGHGGKIIEEELKDETARHHPPRRRRR